MTPGEAESARIDLDLADQALRAARLLLEAGAHEDAVSRLYYAVFHAARASLTVRGVQARTHSGLIEQYQRTFGNTPLLNRLLAWRAQADYERRRFTRPAEALEEALEESARFIEGCRAVVAEASAQGTDDPDPPPDL